MSSISSKPYSSCTSYYATPGEGTLIWELEQTFKNLAPTDPLIYRKLKFLQAHLLKIPPYFDSNALSEKIDDKMVQIWDMIKAGDSSVTPPEVLLAMRLNNLTDFSTSIEPDLSLIYDAIDRFHESLSSHKADEIILLVEIVEKNLYEKLCEIYLIVKGDFLPYSLFELKLRNFRIEFN